MTTAVLPERTQVLVIGGGIIGCSIAYHLTRRGITDVTVLEQGSLTCGTTWHARDDVLVGSTSSGMWSYIQNRCLAMGYVNHDGGVDQKWLDGGTFGVQVGLQRLPLTPSIRSFYDPRNERVRT